MTAKRVWIGTSWKMNKTRAEARDFAHALAASRLIEREAARLFVIPPFTAIAEVAAILADNAVAVGAQNMHWAERGPWTGEISALQIKDCGASMVEIGHSERREHFGETDVTVALKTRAAIEHGLTALVCVGDTGDEYRAGRTAEVLERQVTAALSLIDPTQPGRVVIAYEPVWSIGEGGVPADPDFADSQHALIKAVTQTILGRTLDVIYGGSVNPGNCRELAGKAAIDGLFIGRSAWAAEGYLGIVEAVTDALAGRG